MQKRLFVWGGVAVLTMSLFLAGCNNQKAPAIAIKDGITNLFKVSSYSLDGTVAADLKGPEGQAPAKVTFNLNAGFAFDGKDPNNLILNFKGDGGFDEDGTGGTGAFEVRLDKNMLYALISKLATTGEVQLPDTLKDQYVAKWYKFPMPVDTMKSVSDTLKNISDSVSGQDQSKMTPEQKKTKELFDQTSFFKNPVLAGTDTVKGEASSHYTTTLDKDASLNFLRQVSAIQGSPVSDADYKDMQDSFSKFPNTSFDLWVGNSSATLNRVSVKLTLPGAATDPSGPITVDFSLGDFNKPVTVAVPADATEFSMTSLLDFVGGGDSVDLSGTDLEQTQPVPTKTPVKTPAVK